MTKSPLQQARIDYSPRLPATLHDINALEHTEGDVTTAAANVEALKNLFACTFGQSVILFNKGERRDSSPLRVGVLFSGGQAPGGHNVIAGIFDGLKALDSTSTLYGFIKGADGIIANNVIEITKEIIDDYRNQGGFDMISSSRTKIETKDQFEKSLQTVRSLALDGIVIIGGDDSNTNAAMLAEYFEASQCRTRVIGVPKTIDGDLKNEYIETSFGFDTASKVYSELIGNIARDAISAKKYTFFIKLMGRSASHIALECAMQTHPTMAIIGEEVAAENKTIADITKEICDVICHRAKDGKNYGVILIPEGLIEFIPEFSALIKALNECIKSIAEDDDRIAAVAKALPENLRVCFSSLPLQLQEQLLCDRDPHGNVQVSRIETEKLLIATVSAELKKRKEAGKYSGTFSAINAFFGYEGRSALPTNFDCTYCYALGYNATSLIAHGLTGYMSCIQNLKKPVDEWKALGIPITMMMNIEKRHGQSKAVIKKALVDLNGELFQIFKAERKKWALDDDYRYPGPIQFFGTPEITDSTTFTLQHTT